MTHKTQVVALGKRGKEEAEGEAGKRKERQESSGKDQYRKGKSDE